jgi:hypothetical protein
MKNLCTVSDINYSIKGLTLFESLCEHSENFILHYLCIDQESYDFLKKYENEKLLIYNVGDLINSDSNLKNLRDSEYKYFCWALASYFSNYLLKKNIDSITYIDSDIFFHQSIQTIFDEISNKDVGIFRHRQFELNSYRPEGLYNVGVVFFKNSETGLKVSDWWKDAVLYRKYPRLSTCGDQKYLDEFTNLCYSNEIFVDGNIGHGAPWQWQLYNFDNYEEDGTIIWNGKKQKLIFSHFSQFEYNQKEYIPSKMHHIYTPLSSYINISGLKKIYDDYYYKILLIDKKYAR